MEPDLLGEAFVRMRLKGSLYADDSPGTTSDCSWKLFDFALEQEDK